MKVIFDFIKDHLIELVGLILAYLGLIVPILQYLNSKKTEERDKRFNNFHRLVKELVDLDPITKTIKLDRQIATVFEFRNYPEYFDIIERLLLGLKENWAGESKRILTEIDLTLKYIRYKRIFMLFRVFQRKP
jgi:hypothetical protein